MATKTISFTLDAASIGKAIKELEAYKQDFAARCRRLRELIAERIAWRATEGFNSALQADWFGKNAPSPTYVQVTVEHKNNLSVVFADGEQAVFIEFGAGVYNNGSVGSSPHPWGPENGYLIGSFGKGNGRKNVWGYYEGGDKGKLILTHGTPAAMPMYRGYMEAINTIGELIREVFG